jgi:hypothetical protein
MSENPPDFLSGGGPLVVRKTFSSGGSAKVLESKDIPMIVSNVYRVQLLFPSGCVQLCKVGIFRKEHKLFPLNPEEWLDGNTEVIDFETDIHVETGEKWTLRGFNTDDTYNHTVTARLYIRDIEREPLSVKMDKLEFAILNLVEEFKRFSDLWTQVPEEVKEEDESTESDEST